MTTPGIKMNDSVFPLRLALTRVSFSQRLLDELAEVDWTSFGKMNSHIYRKLLMERFAKANLTSEEVFMIYFLFSAVKNQERVLDGLDTMSDDMKALAWFSKVRAFVDSNLTQYVSAKKKTKKFPAVNIPVTFPGLDLLCWAIWVPSSSWSLTEMYRRTTTSQLDLDDMAQSRAKEGYAYFWNEIVVGTKNPDAKDLKLPAPAMREEYYKNSANDKYPLISWELKIVTIPRDGYSERALMDWFYNVKLNLKLAVMVFFTDGSYKLVDSTVDLTKLEDVDDHFDNMRDVYNKIRQINTARTAAATTSGTAAASGTTGTTAPTPGTSTT